MNQSSFQTQLRRSFIGYVVVIISVTLVLYLGGYALNFYTGVIVGNQENNRAMADTLADQYRNYEEGSDALARCPETRAVLTQNSVGATADLNRILYQFVNEQDFRAYFVLMTPERHVVCSNFCKENQHFFADSPFVGSVISRLQRAPDKTLTFVCTAPLTSAQECALTFCRAVTDEEGEAIGYLFFNLRKEFFRAFEHQAGQAILLTDPYDNIIYTSLDAQMDPMDKQPSGKYAVDIRQSGFRILNGAHYYIFLKQVTKDGWNLYTLIPLEVQFRTFFSDLTMFAILLVLLAGIVAMLTRTFARRNAQEIDELTRAVEVMEPDDMAPALSLQASEEAQQLYLRFRELIRHNNELQNRRRRMEIRHLEEQFNPHFVFNVMETVRYQIGEDPETASEMLLSFANLMRYSIEHADAKVPLETDVEYVNDYLLLQKIRYNNCLHYEFQIPDELLDCQIPKLLLQPIIENSIRHGSRPGKVLELSVEARQEGEDLVFVIRDNGAGIAPDRLAALNESFSLELDSGIVRHIGLYNIHKMLSLLYGASYGLKIESELGVGTRVELRMPYEMEESSC